MATGRSTEVNKLLKSSSTSLFSPAKLKEADLTQKSQVKMATK